VKKASSQKPTISSKQKSLIIFLAFALLLVVWRNTGSQTSSAAVDLSEMVDGEIHLGFESTQRPFQDVVGQMNALAKLDLAAPMTQSSFNIRELLAFNPFLGPRHGSTPGQGSMQLNSQVQANQKNSLSELSEKGARLVSRSPEWDARIIGPEIYDTHLGHVKAIITGGDRPAVLINDQIYFEDQLIGENFRIRTILPDRIIVEPVLP
jgi:hypothetical protein